MFGIFAVVKLVQRQPKLVHGLVWNKMQDIVFHIGTSFQDNAVNRIGKFLGIFILRIQPLANVLICSHLSKFLQMENDNMYLL